MPASLTPARRAARLLGRVAFAGLWIYLLIKLAPHLGAVVGVETGGGEVPAYTVTTLDGRILTADSLRGKVVLVNFWATWCPPCRIEMPALQAMAERHRDRGLVVLGLSRDVGPEDGVRRFLEDRGITYPVAVVGRDLERAFGGVVGYPTSFLVDRTGRVRHKALGPLAMISFEPAVRRLLSEEIARGEDP
jgi:thiol-disulfide isomerase/thioredoxin